MLSIEAPQDERLFETLFSKQVQHPSGIREHIVHYQRCEVGHPDRCYSYLVRIVRQYLESRRQLQTKKELERGRGTSRMAMPAGDSNKGHCFNCMKHGSCRYGRDCSYLHEQDWREKDRARSSNPIVTGRRAQLMATDLAPLVLVPRSRATSSRKARASTGASANFRTPSTPRRDMEGRGQLQLRTASPASIGKANINNNRIEAAPLARRVARQWIVLQWCSRSLLRQRKSSTLHRGMTS